APLRRTGRGGSEHALRPYSGLAKAFHQTENVAVGNRSGHAGHNDRVRDTVKGNPSRQRMGFDLGHLGSFAAEPRETVLPGRRLLRARGGCFLAAAALPERGAGGPWRARRPRLTALMVRRLRLPSATDAPFAVRLLWSSCHPRSGRRWDRPPHHCVA